MIGEVFGSFRITERLASGGMGVVYRAVHVTSGEKAAVKHLLPQFAGDPEMIARFLQEARTAAAIDDPGIVRVYDAGEVATGGAYLVMELLSGETLAARVRRDGALPAATAVAILRQVCRTVGVAHRGRIVHRDLKPDNIFCVPDPDIPVGVRAKVLDFGIAKLLSDAPGFHTMTGCAMGTPGYMAPELWTNAKASDERTDIYALGCIAFELLSGEVAFPGPSLAAFLDQHRNEPPPRLAPALAAYQPVIDRALAKAPADRWQTTDELAAALSSAEDPALAVTRLLPHARSIGGDDRSAPPANASASSGDASAQRKRPNIAKMVVLGAAAVGVLAIVSSVAFRKRRTTEMPAGPVEVCDRVITVSRQVPSMMALASVERIREAREGAVVTFGTSYSDELAAVDPQAFFDVFHESAVEPDALQRWRALELPRGVQAEPALVDVGYARTRDWGTSGAVVAVDEQGREHRLTIVDTMSARGSVPMMLTRHDGKEASWFATRVPAADAEGVARTIDQRLSGTSSFVDPSCPRTAPPPATTAKAIHELRTDDARATIGDDGAIKVAAADVVIVLGIAGEWQMAGTANSVELHRVTPEVDVRHRVRLDPHLVVELAVTATAAAPLHHVETVTLPAPPAGWYAACRKRGDRIVATFARTPRAMPCPRLLDIPFALQPGQTATQLLELHVRRD